MKLLTARISRLDRLADDHGDPTDQWRGEAWLIVQNGPDTHTRSMDVMYDAEAGQLYYDLSSRVAFTDDEIFSDDWMDFDDALHAALLESI